MIIPRVENLIFDKKNSKDEIWMLNYHNISLDHKIIKVFLKHQLKYPKKGFYTQSSAGTIIHTNTNSLIFINSMLKSTSTFYQDLKKIGIIRNFTSGFKIVTIHINKHSKIFEYFGFDPNQIDNQKCEIIPINSNNLYFIKRGNSGLFILPRSFSEYLNQLLNNFSRSLNLNSNDTVEIENYFNLLSKRNT